MKEANRSESPETFDLFAFLSLLGRGWMWIAIFAVVSAGVGAAVAFLITPIYHAEETVQIREERNNASALRSLAGSFGSLGELAGGALGDQRDERSIALAILSSRAIVEEFVRKNNLLPLLYPRRWDAARRQWKPLSPDRIPNLQDGYKKFMDGIFVVNEDKKTNLVTVAVDWKDPVMAAAWVAGLVADANTTLRDRTVRESEANLEYLKAQANLTTVVPLQTALYSLMETEYKKLMVAKNNEDSVFRVVDPVQVPKRKARPQRLFIVLAAFGLGLVAGVGYVMFVNARRAYKLAASRP
jgi:uncharacterized protein involved in exopolysaccharide biosynthesis